jgi:hypothetical protein
MSITHAQYQTRTQIFTLVRGVLSETTGNRIEDIREESLIYNELNLTEFDLHRIIKEVGAMLELDVESLSETIKETESEVTSVGDLVDLLVDEKELG